MDKRIEMEVNPHTNYSLSYIVCLTVNCIIRKKQKMFKFLKIKKNCIIILDAQLSVTGQL